MGTGFDFADIYDEVVSRSGGEQTTAEDVQRVRRGMRLVLERWEQKGYNTWRIKQTTVTAAGSASGVKLSACVDDVLQVLSQGSSAIERIPMARYMQIPDKDATGSPSQWALFRSDPPVLRLYPCGSTTATDTLEVWYVERPEAFDNVANLDSDVPGRWLEALILSLAHDFARKRPGLGGYNEALIARLDAERREAEDICMRSDRDRARYRYRISV
jgi:hypothetical protein